MAADGLMDRFFRAHPYLGARDRGQIAEIVYGCLRQYRLLTTLAQKTDALAVIATYLALVTHASARELATLGIHTPEALVAAIHQDRSHWPWALNASLPDWLADQLQSALGEDQARTLAHSFLNAAPLDVRVNTLKTDRARLQESLAQEGHDLTASPYSPWGLRRPSRASVFRTTAFAAGHFEVQDEGSQLIAPLLEPRRGERIVDYCAGAGGKTLHLGALMANSGTLYAFDTAQKRLDRLKERVVRAGLDNIRIQTITGGNDHKLKRLAGKIDRVLVDAPCSGTGTLRRSPDIKWRLTPERITASAQTALHILIAAARLVRPGGRLVYATCSVLPEENTAVIDAFLAVCTDFKPVNSIEILQRRGIPLPQHINGTEALHLWPHQHGTDGFYAQALDRV